MKAMLKSMRMHKNEIPENILPLFEHLFKHIKEVNAKKNF